MTEPVLGLTGPAGKLLNEMADKHRQRLPDVGRRTRRVYSSEGGAVPVVLGPCGQWVPDVADLPTDLEVAYPDGCDGPEALGLTYQNLSSGIITFKRLVYVPASSPFRLDSDTWTHACATGNKTVYVKVVVNGLDVEEVVLTFYDDSDDSVLAEYHNKFYTWQALVGGYLQLKTHLCNCSTFPYDICVDAPEA